MNKTAYELYQNVRQYVPAFSVFVCLVHGDDTSIFPWRDNIIEIWYFKAYVAHISPSLTNSKILLMQKGH